MTETDERAAAMVDNAAKLIARYGWVRGGGGGPGGFCVNAAILAGAQRDGGRWDAEAALADPASRRAQQAVCEAVGVTGRAHPAVLVASWNDSACTGVTEALAALSVAASILRPDRLGTPVDGSLAAAVDAVFVEAGLSWPS